VAGALAALAEAILASAGVNLDMGGGCGHWRTRQRVGAILAGAGRAGRAGASPPSPGVFADARSRTTVRDMHVPTATSRHTIIRT
jgi:hypothetical protein